MADQMNQTGRDVSAKEVAQMMGVADELRVNRPDLLGLVREALLLNEKGATEMDRGRDAVAQAIAQAIAQVSMAISLSVIALGVVESLPESHEDEEEAIEPRLRVALNAGIKFLRRAEWDKTADALEELEGIITWQVDGESSWEAEGEGAEDG